jgi:hypothetical protein
MKIMKHRQRVLYKVDLIKILSKVDWTITLVITEALGKYQDKPSKYLFAIFSNRNKDSNVAKKAMATDNIRYTGNAKYCMGLKTEINICSIF